MKIGMIYDFGVNKGGGDLVMLNILEALDSTGHDTTLMTSKPDGLGETSKLFGRKGHHVNIRQIKVPSFLHHPYTIAYMAKKIAKKDNSDLFVLSDDVPKCLSDRRVVCYVHYPHAARFVFREYVAKKYREKFRGKIAWWLHKWQFPKFYPTQQVSSMWLLIANSVVTMKHVFKTYNLKHENAALLNPPVASEKIHTLWKKSNLQKEDLVVCIGRLERDRRFEDLLHAMALLKDELDFRLNIIGFSHDESYLKELTRTVRILELEDKVDLLLDVTRESAVNELLKAKALVQNGPHEPFGIAVVEGMAAGCIPIVRKGANGPWIEIIEKGKYGLGFETIAELSSALNKVIEDYDNFDVGAISSRTLEFDERMFKSGFLEVLKRFLGISHG